MNDEKTWIEFIRKEELSVVRKYLPDSRPIKILEIGGKDGYLAKILSDWGFDVTSIDTHPSTTYFDVIRMDGTILEFKAKDFDLVFSSHLVAHIIDKRLLFSEINRVLKDDGLVIHIVPSNWWSLITNFWHYVLLPYFFYKYMKNKKTDSEKIEASIKKDLNYKKKRLKNLILFHPLGTEKSFFNELFKFSKSGWKKLFLSNGYTINNIIGGPLLYSGHGICKMKFISVRRIIGNFFSSSYCFILIKKEGI